MQNLLKWCVSIQLAPTVRVLIECLNDKYNVVRVKNFLQSFSPKRLHTWWKNMPLQQQERFSSLGTLFAVLLFVLASITVIAYLRVQEISNEKQTLQRDAEFARQQLSVRMNQQLETLQHTARSVALWGLDDAALEKLTQQLAAQAPEIHEVIWLNAQGHVLEKRASNGDVQQFLPQDKQTLPTALARSILDEATRTRIPVYGVQSATSNNNEALLLIIPTQVLNRIQGYLYVRYNQLAILNQGIPQDIQQRHTLTLRSNNYAATRHEPAAWWQLQWLLPQRVAGDAPLALHYGQLSLHLQSYQTGAALHSRVLLGFIVLLSALITWILIANWLHVRKRIRTQHRLHNETNFRRAMEDSLITGMRALDLTGCITHVNAAFCEMTGFSEKELVGQVAPFSYWYPDDIERNQRALNNTLQKQLPRGGYEMRVMRKDGEVFEARMYMSPLVGADGDHIGWMSSMTDITESNRFKRQLSASYERFGRVLDALDVAVSVAPLGGTELLFANKSYRQWFGADAVHGHLKMLSVAGSPSAEHAQANSLGQFNASNNEIYMESIERWVEVRSRYLHWRDGVLAQLVIATDITQRKEAQALSEQHEQQAQAAGRLVTMGEMASSFAHELNQPLTAIHNYCSGMRDRISSGNMSDEELLKALEKTANQAQRAGTIIQRIREFVKRSAPNYAPTQVQQMVADAVDLASIEMRRRFIRFSCDMHTQTESIMADRILIEQVLVNLMKNAAEAIDNANKSSEQRNVQLIVDDTQIDDKPVLRFRVYDSGTGLGEDTLNHIFDAFFTTKKEGLGIGLNLCRSIVEAHQGRLHAENLYNEEDPAGMGCCFTFWLPIYLGH